MCMLSLDLLERLVKHSAIKLFLRVVYRPPIFRL